MEGAEVEVKVTPVEAASQTAGGRTGAELAQIWPTLPHLSAEEAAMFESDLAQARTAEGGQPAPEWE
jgi:2-methylcitrate dehydratase PrpD